MKLMSLFDGSGGFPLAASLCGIEPVYAAEVEPYPIAVTKNRFPKMKHLGDVSKVKGGEIEPVDIITFGSPCQDMSIAGKRAGLKHADMGDDETTRSGLFLEAIRIIKEMREATNGVYPRYAIWENVPGAFSSNRGEDFRTVLEEFIRVKEKDAVMPAVPQAGWAYADCISGDGWSIAYRVFDAQYWGVPQRRRRIYLVADFRGECAQEILFKRESLRGYFEAGRTPWQGMAADAQNCVGTAKCARLQGFPDWWGEIPKKDNLTDDEYVFWLNARNTYAKINNKTTKEYSKEQMLSWYNKLHSDSSEYKMWGNGIALPNALYVMQGIAEVVGVHHSK